MFKLLHIAVLFFGASSMLLAVFYVRDGVTVALPASALSLLASLSIAVYSGGLLSQKALSQRG